MLHRINNVWSKQAYLQVFDFKNLPFKKAINMFERMKISEQIYKGVVEKHYKNPTERVYSSRDGIIRKYRG